MKPVEPEEVAAVIIATLEGAVMLSKLCRDEAPLKRAVTHLHRYIRTEV